MARKRKGKVVQQPAVRAMRQADILTPHRRRHDEFELETTVERAGPYTDSTERAQTPRNMTMFPIDRLHRRRRKDGSTILDDYQHAAGCKLHEDFSKALMAARVIGRYDEMIGHGSVQDHRINQSQAYRDWSRAMDYVGMGGFNVLWDVVCRGEDPGSEERTWHLGQMLHILVDYYKL
mgnify:CR=1 FL=1